LAAPPSWDLPTPAAAATVTPTPTRAIGTPAAASERATATPTPTPAEEITPTPTPTVGPVREKLPPSPYQALGDYPRPAGDDGYGFHINGSPYPPSAQQMQDQ